MANYQQCYTPCKVAGGQEYVPCTARQDRVVTENPDHCTVWTPDYGQSAEARGGKEKMEKVEECFD